MSETWADWAVWLDREYQEAHLRIAKRPTWNSAKGTHRVRFKLEPGCNCVLLTAVDLDRNGKPLRYGSYGAIDNLRGIYDWFVVRGALTDLRPLLPFKNYDDAVPSNHKPHAWGQFLDRIGHDQPRRLSVEVLA